MRDESYKDMLGLNRPAAKVNGHGQEPLEPVPPDAAEEDARGEGRSARHQTLMVVLEFENRNAPSVLYGAIVGAPYHDPSRGLQFIWEGLHCVRWDEWRQGHFKVSILGTNLERIRDRLVAGKRELIREKGDVTEIRIEEWLPPKK